jgi:adenosine deaminase/adenosine deaminase CECR1
MMKKNSPTLFPHLLIGLLASLTIVLAAGAGAKEVPDNGMSRNGQTTARYYEKLLAGDAPQLAELNLLMNLMPKGGDLHHHYSGAIYAETYLDWLGKEGYCVYRHDDPADCSDTYPAAKNCHAGFHIETASPGGKPTDHNCLTAQQIQEDNGFYRALLMHWSDKDFANHSHESIPPDQQFFDTFGFFGPASGYSPATGLTMLKQQAKADNLQYLETMLKGAPATENVGLSQRFNELAPDADSASIRQILLAYADFLDQDGEAQKRILDYRNALAGYAKGIDDGEFALRFQSYVSRNNPPGMVFAGLYSAFAAAHDNRLIVGVNIVGPENGVVAMRDYRLHMEMFHFLKQRFSDVRLAMHAGELTLGMVPPPGLRNHIRDAIDVAGAERIGHGIDLTYESDPDTLLEDLKKRDVAIEICLSSNAFILGVEKEAHPVTVYLRHRVPIVIATDDEGVSRSNISAEYLLFVSRYKPSYRELKEVVYNSLRYAFLSPDERKLQIKQLDARFGVFEAAVAKLASAVTHK